MFEMKEMLCQPSRNQPPSKSVCGSMSASVGTHAILVTAVLEAPIHIMRSISECSSLNGLQQRHEADASHVVDGHVAGVVNFVVAKTCVS